MKIQEVKNNWKKLSLKEVRERAKELYKKTETVYCPYLKEEVTFNSEGFSHLRYKGARRERHVAAQEMRYKLLGFAPKIIEHSNTLQEYHEEEQVFVVKHKGEKKTEKKIVRYYAFIAIMGNNLSQAWKSKVIVRKIGEGKFHFWSIIPNWKTRKSKEGRKNFQNFTGNLSED